MSSELNRRLRVALDPALAPWAPEVKYAWRTLLRIAGYSHEFVWSSQVEPTDAVDIYYGNSAEHHDAAVRVQSFLPGYSNWSNIDPHRVVELDGMPFMEFETGARPAMEQRGGRVDFNNDFAFSSFWLLVGAAEARFPRDRWDNLHAEQSFIVANGLLTRPPVSHYATWLRRYFEGQGRAALKPGWVKGGHKAAFCFTHDVDYPQMIRWIETLRLLRARGPRALPSIADIWRGTNHFWKFDDWVELEHVYGARPAFYFMARQGSLWEYARGTPDAFYDIESRAFQELFPRLRTAGSEIGLHASYHAHKSTTQLHNEKTRLEQAAGVTVQGGRHHYWHLDPDDPHETLFKHEQIGMQYDSSLGLEFYPGFRRGCCHPFRVYHAGQRRELDIVQLPPAWMDDHFDRRRLVNHIEHPEAVARGLLDVARETGGIAIVDYHARGLNEDFYPMYGRWLREFAARNFDSSLRHCTPGELCSEYKDYARVLDAASEDRAEPAHLNARPARPSAIATSLPNSGSEN